MKHSISTNKLYWYLVTSIENRDIDIFESVEQRPSNPLVSVQFW